MLRFAVILAITLALYWLTLSGYFKPILLTFGALSVLFTVYLCARMKILDDETVPYLNVPKTLSYFVWLFGEVIKANLQVAKAVLSPEMKISPTLVKIPAHQDTEIGKTMFANSITLTPGTVSVCMEDEDHILVHALLKEMSDPQDFTEMGERAGWSVGEPIKLQRPEEAG